MKKIAIIQTNLAKIFGNGKSGGGEILIRRLISELLKNPDINITVITSYQADIEKIKQENSKINFVLISGPQENAEYLEQIKSVNDRENFDIVINNNVVFLYETSLLQCHSFIHRCCNSPWYLRLIRKLISKRKTDFQKNVYSKLTDDMKFVAVSQIIKNDYSKNFGINPENIVVSYPGTDKIYNEYPDIYKHQSPIFGIASGSSINKGCHYFLFAMGLLKLLGRKFKIKIIAPKYNKDIFMKFIIKLFGMSKIVEVLPFQFDMTNFYRGIDIMVLPSLNEAFGLVVLEAMACAKPCIVSSTAGSAEIINDKNGYLFNRYSFFEFLKTLLKVTDMYNNDWETYKKYSYSAWEYSLKYTWQRFVEQIIY